MGNCISCVKSNRESFQPQRSPSIETGRGSTVSLRIFSRHSSPDPTLLLLDPDQCTVTWNQSNQSTVGDTTVATIQFVRRNLEPYVLDNADVFKCSVIYLNTMDPLQYIQEPVDNLTGSENIRISFIARKSGNYQIRLTINDKLIGGIQYMRSYQSGPPDPRRTVFPFQNSFVITRCDEYQSVLFCPKDQYDNLATIDQSLFNFKTILGGPDGAEVPSYVDLAKSEHLDSGYYKLSWKIDSPDYYEGCVVYGISTMGIPSVQIYCLSDEGMSMVEENVQQLFLRIGYEAQLIRSEKGKPKRVQCFISPRLFQVRDFALFKLITSRVFTCRVCHATKLIMHQEPGVFTIDDGLHNAITLRSSHREVIAAIFNKFLHKNTGGGNVFVDKKQFFSNEVNKLATDGSEVAVTVDRAKLLKSVMSATKRMKPKDWRRHFYVKFQGEPGIDVGGVSREMFGCLCDQLFGADSNDGLFMRFNDECMQSLVHPNTRRRRSSKLKLSHYEFAGKVVGKCLYETAIGNPLFVKARFTRSFLAQIIGLRVTWKHFETDDPDLYQHKVTVIRNTSISDLDMSLRFTEDVYEEHDGVVSPTTVALGPGGENKRVTDENKMDYLNNIAQYRLVSQVADEISHFLKGLHQIIPEELLSIFNESELELLMCGMQEISFTDLRHHAQVRGQGSSHFEQVMNWFWAVVGEFSQEELARLVQFVTGSSQLPPEGFKELRPPFLIAASGGTPNRLPYAHTCFNHLCLSDYDSFEQFRRCLLIAINEGNEGFLLE